MTPLLYSMTYYKYPVLVWQDYQGMYTGRFVDQEIGSQMIAATGLTVESVLAELKELIQWQAAEWHQSIYPNFESAQLITFRVEVRPEHQFKNRRFPASETVALRAACVYGEQHSGLLVAALPMLGIQFYYYQPGELKNLVLAYVQESFKGASTRQIVSLLDPKSLQLLELSVNVGKVKYARPKVYSATQTLEMVAEPLGDPALRRQFGRAYERETEIQLLVKKLTEETPNLILLGESGSGKSTVLVEAVRQAELYLKKAEAETDRSRPPRRYWLTSGSRLIAGMMYLGQWQERCETVIDEINSIGGVLCVGNLLELVEMGGTSPLDSIATFLMPFLQRNELRMVVEATPAELDACRRLLPGLVELFQIVRIDSFSREKALSVLEQYQKSLEKTFEVLAETNVADTTHRLFARFQPTDGFPGLATRFLHDVFDRQSRAKAPAVTAHHVIAHYVRQTGLPETFLRDEILLQLSSVDATLQSQVIGQPDACRLAAQVITTFKAGLNDPHRPVAVLLFCGPTGVGKTELAKAISRYLFGSGQAAEQRLIRLDMSEYSGYGALDRLFTAPNGKPGQLIERIRRQPFSVVLFDEIEKADEAVFDALLGVFDEGRLTDRFGRTTSFRNAVIVMTSNLGADLSPAIGYGASTTPPYEKVAMSFFRPEFFNRLDAVVRFQALTPSMVLDITRKELSEISQREGFTKARLQLAWSETLVAQCAREGYDVRYGARPLQRTLESTVVAPLARYLLQHPKLRSKTLFLDWSTQTSTLTIVSNS